jgi:hypothetical protein
MDHRERASRVAGFMNDVQAGKSAARGAIEKGGIAAIHSLGERREGNALHGHEGAALVVAIGDPTRGTATSERLQSPRLMAD